MKRVHVVLSGVEDEFVCLSPCVHFSCRTCRYDWMFAFAILMSLCGDVMVMSSA